MEHMCWRKGPILSYHFNSYDHIEHEMSESDYFSILLDGYLIVSLILLKLL